MTLDRKVDSKDTMPVLEMRRLSEEDIRIEPSYDGVHIIASLFENPKGYRHWDKYKLSDLPNDLISLNDLERFGVNIIDIETRRGS